MIPSVASMADICSRLTITHDDLRDRCPDSTPPTPSAVTRKVETTRATWRPAALPPALSRTSARLPARPGRHARDNPPCPELRSPRLMAAGGRSPQAPRCAGPSRLRSLRS